MREKDQLGLCFQSTRVHNSGMRGAESSHLTQIAERKLGMICLFLKPQPPPQKHTFPNKNIPPKPSQSISVRAHQEFKHDLWGHSHSQHCKGILWQGN